MSIKKKAWIFLTLFLVYALPSFALKPVENSSEELFWSHPMTAHDYKKSTDLHSVAVSAMAMTELEFVQLGDGLLSLSLKNKKSPIANSLDSLEYAYSKLPRVEPVVRVAQLFDALQLRQISLSDARLLTSVLIGDAMGGITPLMQVRAYKLIVWVEDVIYDVDKTMMSPLNRGVSLIRREPSNLKSLGYVADGLGQFRWEFFSGLKWVSREVVQFSSDMVHAVEKPYDGWIRHKRKKTNARVMIYSKMPLSVFQEYRAYFSGKKKKVMAGTLQAWRSCVPSDGILLPDKIQPAELSSPDVSAAQDLTQEILVLAEYSVWDQVPRELKKYVITQEEAATAIRSLDEPGDSSGGAVLGDPR